MEKFLVKFVAILLIAGNSFGYIPPIIQRCPRNVQNAPQCLLSAVEKLRPNLASGDFGPNFNVPRMEPLYLDRVDMNRGQDFNFVVTDAYVSGPSKFVVTETKEVDIPNLIFDFVIQLPKTEVVGNYNLKMRLALLDLKGSGPMKASFNNLKVRLRLKGNVDSSNLVRFKKIGVKIERKVNHGAKIELSNLFGGDKALGQIGNQVINDNIELFIDELLPGLENSLSKTFGKIVNQILATTTYDEMFPLQ